MGPKRVRQEFRQTDVKLAGSVADAQNLAVGPEFVQDLPAGATGSGRGLGGREDDDRLQRDGPYTPGHGLEDRIALGADRETVRGVFHVAAREDLSIAGQDRGADG